MKYITLTWIHQPFLLVLIGFSVLVACNQTDTKNGHKLFSRLDGKATGISFANTIVENDSVNLIVNEYAYMGGGVGIIDVNNDGLQDIFFSGNQVSSRLYLNEGDNHFKDISQTANVGTDRWCTGVSVVDINNDGYKDLYVCVSGSFDANRRKNLLFVNNRNQTFSEKAAEYGLADTGFSTQAAFFDYDNDGDLDMYLVNHIIGGSNPNDIIKKDISGKSLLNDRLYRNNGIDPIKGHAVFEDVTLNVGILEDGNGLGIAVSDLNNDGWQDIYITNDYLSNDLLWLNQKDGTFKNVIGASLNHQSYSSMGVDASDVNNDALVDIATTDMQPEPNNRKKEMFSFLSNDRYELERRAGYEPEFSRNMLQLNNGNLQIRDTLLPRFSEIGQFAGISETDWSWSVLLADFDNDGWKDMHVTNGFGRDLINGDFVLYRSQMPASSFSNPKDRISKLTAELKNLGEISLRNYFYRNKHDNTFYEETKESGIDEASISNGAAYADFDNDGDLDLVVNNINQDAFYFVNNSNSNRQVSKSTNFLSIDLIGSKLNLDAIGTKIYVESHQGQQFFEESPVRGYASSVDHRIFAGLGIDTVVNLKIEWPDGKVTQIQNVKANQHITVSWNDSISLEKKPQSASIPLFTDVTQSKGVNFKQTEVFFNDFAYQRLLPHKYSQLGPFISVGDLNRDGRFDFFIGGPYNQSGKIFLQKKDGGFSSTDLVKGPKMEEDLGSVLFDCDQDGDLDLLLVSASTEFQVNSKWFGPRLYINKGDGSFIPKQDAFPGLQGAFGMTVKTIDYDGDKDMDIIIAGRVSHHFPASPRSMILENVNSVFHDVTNKVCPELANAGMISGLAVFDFDQDGKQDFVVAGEWMPLLFFRNMGAHFESSNDKTGLTNTNGLWRSLETGDVDNDGDLDLIAGNTGLNNPFKASSTEPMWMYSADLDLNGTLDPVIGSFRKGTGVEKQLYPLPSFTQMMEQVPSLRRRYYFFKDYAQATLDDLFKSNDPNLIQKFYCDELQSCWFENKGGGNFTKHALPNELQFAPLNAVVCADFNGDGINDLLCAGNDYQSDVAIGRYDASYGSLLKGVGKGQFEHVSPMYSGFAIQGDVKDLELVRTSDNSILVLAGVNNDFMKCFSVNNDKR